MIQVDRSANNPNVNCLEGKRCPRCGSFGPFEVVATVRVLLTDNGTLDKDDSLTEYASDAHTICHLCRYDGRFGAFDELIGKER